MTTLRQLMAIAFCGNDISNEVFDLCRPGARQLMHDMQYGRPRFDFTIRLNHSIGGAFGVMAIPDNVVAFGIFE